MGRNYREHARELGNEPPGEPLIFLKPPSSVIPAEASIVLPPGAGRVDFEGEIGFVVGRRVRHLAEHEALDCLSHVLALNDVTGRDFQRADEQWTRAKGFDTFCPMAPPTPLSALPEERAAQLRTMRVETYLNGELRQSGALTDLVFSLAELLVWTSRIMTLEPGDVLATGTPAGVGPLAIGDRVRVTVPGFSMIENPVEGGTELSWGEGGGGNRSDASV